MVIVLSSKRSGEIYCEGWSINSRWLGERDARGGLVGASSEAFLPHSGKHKPMRERACSLYPEVQCEPLPVLAPPPHAGPNAFPFLVLLGAHGPCYIRALQYNKTRTTSFNRQPSTIITNGYCRCQGSLLPAVRWT